MIKHGSIKTRKKKERKRRETHYHSIQSMSVAIYVNDRVFQVPDCLYTMDEMMSVVIVIVVGSDEKCNDVHESHSSTHLSMFNKIQITI
jgi:hypothetical protein